MSGPRVTSGQDSKQDYATPVGLMLPVSERFGTIVFDLAAHAQNKKCAKYFAPPEVSLHLEPPFDEEEVAAASHRLSIMGAGFKGAEEAVYEALQARSVGEKKKGRAAKKDKIQVVAKNLDKEAYGLDALSASWNWAEIYRELSPDGKGLMWLNCEFNDVPTWAERCVREAKAGARIALLTPAMVGSNWYRDLIAPHADVYMLNGRVSFDGNNVYPKDCMVSIYGPGSSGLNAIWDWRKNEILREWQPVLKHHLFDSDGCAEFKCQCRCHPENRP